jgi:S1-C subfamily serine protease
VPVVVWRDGRSRTFTVTLKGRDDPGYASWLTEMNQGPTETFEPQLEEDQVVNLEEWGIGVANLDNRARRRFQVAHGVYIAFVTPAGPFDGAGIPRGVVITAINDVPVFNIDSLGDALRFSGDLLVRVARDDGSTAFFEVKRAQEE